jgi:hypothetical protein
VAVRFADNAVLGKIGFDQPTHHRFGGAVSSSINGRRNSRWRKRCDH